MFDKRQMRLKLYGVTVTPKEWVAEKLYGFEWRQKARNEKRRKKNATARKLKRRMKT